MVTFPFVCSTTNLVEVLCEVNGRQLATLGQPDFRRDQILDVGREHVSLLHVFRTGPGVDDFTGVLPRIHDLAKSMLMTAETSLRKTNQRPFFTTVIWSIM